MTQTISIVELPPLRVASFHAFGAQPEEAAQAKLIAWVKKHPIWNEKSRIFGFNNPNPAPGSENYGYEFWITVGQEVESDGEAEVKQFSGGKYALMRCPVLGNPENIVNGWQNLVKWREGTHYQHDPGHQWLEEHIGGLEVDFEHLILDLYAPISA